MICIAIHYTDLTHFNFARLSVEDLFLLDSHKLQLESLKSNTEVSMGAKHQTPLEFWSLLLKLIKLAAINFQPSLTLSIVFLSVITVTEKQQNSAAVDVYWSIFVAFKEVMYLVLR